ncbi:hypothetical protein RFI_12996 [Reticulomyxa filosa]|uniref:Uncharacterized protein n=1 Tax=Reticulomyxa filosa TaxID=46433 RepID=X6NE46_RETFI|nr:hypothetical protein RFI_12996 [Reticulomyxa filosa]|eukprot:ETO24163.1 hypothetical protein RFI_12996 [Reticulomyxa filosa]
MCERTNKSKNIKKNVKRKSKKKIEETKEEEKTTEQARNGRGSVDTSGYQFTKKTSIPIGLLPQDVDDEMEAEYNKEIEKYLKQQQESTKIVFRIILTGPGETGAFMCVSFFFFFCKQQTN